MSDNLHRFFLENLQIRGEWVSLKKSWNDIQNTADYPPPVRDVLGEALAAISLLSESLKFDGSLTLQIRGTEPVTLLVVQASSDGNIRGIARWQGDIPEKSSFNELFGSGTMVISVENTPKENAQQGERYQSLVSLEGNSLANCFKEYFAQSEQLNSSFWLAADKNCAAGIMLQSLPADDMDPKVQQNNWTHASILADTLKDEELLTLDAETILTRLYHEEDLRLYDANPVRFSCSCSQEKIENTVFSLGSKEANEILEEQSSISIDCEFCNTNYELDEIDIKRIFAEKMTTQAGSGNIH